MLVLLLTLKEAGTVLTKTQEKMQTKKTSLPLSQHIPTQETQQINETQAN